MKSCTRRRHIPAPPQDWISIFLGILVEASPFLLLGVAVSSLVHVFVPEDTLLRLVPKHPVLSLVPALFLGVLMPVCECGNVAVARRFLAKGVPISTCIAFLLASPILNPVALFATATAFRYQPDVVWLRAGLAFIIAAGVGLFVGGLGQGEALLAPGVEADRSQRLSLQRQLTFAPGDRHGAHSHDHEGHHHHHGHDHAGGIVAKLQAAALGAGTEFIGMMQVLLLGAAVAAATQVLIPRSAITGIGTGVVLAVVAMMSLAFVLSICSTVDAFFALSYSSLFPTPALVAFLVLGPMLGMKSTGLMLTAFRPKAVLAIAGLTAELVFLGALLLHLRGVLL